MIVMLVGIIVNLLVFALVAVTARITTNRTTAVPPRHLDLTPTLEQSREIRRVSEQALQMRQADRARVVQHVA